MTVSVMYYFSCMSIINYHLSMSNNIYSSFLYLHWIFIFCPNALIIVCKLILFYVKLIVHFRKLNIFYFYISCLQTSLISSKGYPVEDYTVQTKDGYLLSVQRIPHGRVKSNSVKKPVVFLQHGLLSSATDWVINFPSEALGNYFISVFALYKIFNQWAFFHFK